MTTAHSGERARKTIGEAVLRVSGVAFLRPALGDLLRSATTSRLKIPAPGPASQRTAGIRITSGAQGGEPAVEVHVVLLRGYRALDVTRAIRETVRAQYPGAPRTIPVHVTVTGIV
ncbi:Asp23/Gls24 family envelope stress response protein [Streptomyces sp. NPDC059917]|uniref:Asp23/Gls24 family envelope stress response protein n=1 Tax=Streptomyces sp. NPDC059917 TaxID=3347002 RepID=UPI0036560E45